MQENVARYLAARGSFAAEHHTSRAFLNPNAIAKVRRCEHARVLIAHSKILSLIVFSFFFFASHAIQICTELALDPHASRYDAYIYAGSCTAAASSSVSGTGSAVHIGPDQHFKQLARVRERAEEEDARRRANPNEASFPASSPLVPAVQLPVLPVLASASASVSASTECTEPAPKKTRRSKWDDSSSASGAGASSASAPNAGSISGSSDGAGDTQALAVANARREALESAMRRAGKIVT